MDYDAGDEHPYADVPRELVPLAQTLDQIPALRAKLRAAAEDMTRISRLCAEVLAEMPS